MTHLGAANDVSSELVGQRAQGSACKRESAAAIASYLAIARARRCFEVLLSGRAASVEAVAALEGIDRSYVSRLLPLAFLSPDIVQAIVRGSQPAHMTAKALIQRIDLPLDWLAQRQTLGFP